MCSSDLSIYVDGSDFCLIFFVLCCIHSGPCRTDYVFDGQGETPCEPDCKAYAPLNVYGQTKLGGELAVAQTLEKYFFVRIAWVFGLNGKNFIKTMSTSSLARS